MLLEKLSVASGVVVGGGWLAISSALPDTRQNKVHENNQMQSGGKEVPHDTAARLRQVAAAPVTVPCGRVSEFAGMENSPPDF